MSAAKKYHVQLDIDEVNLIRIVLRKYVDFYEMLVDDPDYTAEEKKEIKQDIEETGNLINKISYSKEQDVGSQQIDFAENELKYLIVCLSEDRHSRTENVFLEKDDAIREKKKEEVVMEYGLVEKLMGLLGKGDGVKTKKTL